MKTKIPSKEIIFLQCSQSINQQTSLILCLCWTTIWTGANQHKPDTTSTVTGCRSVSGLSRERWRAASVCVCVSVCESLHLEVVTEACSLQGQEPEAFPVRAGVSRRGRRGNERRKRGISRSRSTSGLHQRRRRRELTDQTFSDLFLLTTLLRFSRAPEHQPPLLWACPALWESTHTHTHTHTLTHTHVGFAILVGTSIGVMVFVLYRPYILLPYTNPTPKLSPHRRLFAFLHFKINFI